MVLQLHQDPPVDPIWRLRCLSDAEITGELSFISYKICPQKSPLLSHGGMTTPCRTAGFTARDSVSGTVPVPCKLT